MQSHRASPPGAQRSGKATFLVGLQWRAHMSLSLSHHGLLGVRCLSLRPSHSAQHTDSHS